MLCFNCTSFRHSLLMLCSCPSCSPSRAPKPVVDPIQLISNNEMIGFMGQASPVGEPLSEAPTPQSTPTTSTRTATTTGCGPSGKTFQRLTPKTSPIQTSSTPPSCKNLVRVTMAGVVVPKQGRRDAGDREQHQACQVRCVRQRRRRPIDRAEILL